MKIKYKTDLQNLLLKDWIEIEKVAGDGTDRLEKLLTYISDKDNVLVEDMRTILEECKWIAQLQGFKPSDVSSFKIEDEEYIYCRDLDKYTVSQFVSYSSTIKVLKENPEVIVDILICMTKLNCEVWDLSLDEYDRRKELFLNSSCINALEIINFWIPLDDNSLNATQLSQEDVQGEEKKWLEKMNFGKDGVSWGRLLQGVKKGLKRYLYTLS
jgi:hypothetical protein